MEVSRISGPVNIRVLVFRDRTFYLFSDRHNSKEGGCESSGGQCADFNKNNTTNTKNNCITFPYFVHKFLLKGNKSGGMIDFYLESPFVIIDDVPNIKPDMDGLDYIDTLQVVMRPSLMRSKDKSVYMPHGRVHYTDIRDIYDKGYDPDGLRRSNSANPLSFSWIVKKLNRAIESGNISNIIQTIDFSISLISFVLDNAKLIFKAYTSEFNPPKCSFIGVESDNYNKRIGRMSSVTSVFNGKRVHRVCKQLLKLNKRDSDMILRWATSRFDNELKHSNERFEEWKTDILSLVDMPSDDNNNRSDSNMSDDNTYAKIEQAYEKIRHIPVMISVALGSVIMDIYVLARAIYHDFSKEVIIFGGSAHIDNYLDFFTKSGCDIISVIEPYDDNKERCMLFRTTV